MHLYSVYNAEEVQITEQPRSQPVRAGATVTLRCKATGYPTPEYKWIKDGMELPDGVEEELTFDCVTLEDSGRYKCIVSNRMNAEKSNIVELQVLPSPGELLISCSDYRVDTRTMNSIFYFFSSFFRTSQSQP